MKHNIRINGQVQQFDCELGSGIKDKNGVEIFEGDIVKMYSKDGIPFNGNRKVSFKRGLFLIGYYWINDLPPCDLEVVGHIAEDN